MKACVDYALNGDAIWYNGKSVSASARRPRTIPDGKRQEFWRKWQNVEGGEEERK